MKLLLKYLLLCSVIFLPQAHLYAQGPENEVSVDQTSTNNSVIPRQSLSDDHSLATWLKNKIDRLRGKEPTASKYHSEILVALADDWNREMHRILTHENLQGEIARRQVESAENSFFGSFGHLILFAINGMYINDANKARLIQERVIVTPKNFDRFLSIFLNNFVLPDFESIDPKLATQWKQSVDQVIYFRVDQEINPMPVDFLENRGEVAAKSVLLTPEGLITAISLEEFQNRMIQWDLLMAQYRVSSHEFKDRLETQLRAIFPEVSGDFLSYQFIKPFFRFINPSGRVILTEKLEGGYEQLSEHPDYNEAEVKITEFLSRSGIVVITQESESNQFEINKLRKVMMWNRFNMEGGGSRNTFYMTDSYEQAQPMACYSLLHIKADDNGRPVLVRDQSVEAFHRMVPIMDESALTLSRTNHDYLFLDERRIIPQDQVVMMNPAELIEYIETVEKDVASSNGYRDFPDILKFDVKTVDLLIYKIHNEQWNKDEFEKESSYKDRSKNAISILMRYLDEADLMWKYIQEGKQSTYGVLSSREAFMWFLYHPEKIKEMETAKLLVYGLGSWEKNRFWNAYRTHPERFEKFTLAYRNHDRVYDAYHYAAENGIDVDKYEGTGLLGKGLFGYAYSDEFSAVRYKRLDQLGLIDHEKERPYDWREWRPEPWWKRLINRARPNSPELFVQQPQIFNVIEAIQMIDRELAESSYSPEDIRKFLKEIKRNPYKNESWSELTESIDYEQLLKDDPAKAEKFIQYSIYIDNHEEIGTFSKFKLIAAFRNWIQIELAEGIARYESTKVPEKKSFVAAFKGACDRLIFGSHPDKAPTIVYFKFLIKGKNKAPVDKILEVINSMDDFRTFVLAHNEVHPDRKIVNDLSYYSQKQMWDYPGLPQLGAKIKGFIVSKAFPIPENLALERQSKTSFDISQSALEELPEEKSEVKTAKGRGKSGYMSSLGLAPLLAGNSDKPGLLNSLVGWIGNEVLTLLHKSPNNKVITERKSNGDLVVTTRNEAGKPESIQVSNAAGNKTLQITYEYAGDRTIEVISDRDGKILSRSIFTNEKLITKTVYHYYAGKIARKTSYNAKNIILEEADYVYDADDKIRSKKIYSADGRILSRVEFDYDIQRRVIARTQYDATGKVTDRQTFIPNAEYITFNDYLTRSRRGSEKGTRPFIARYTFVTPYDFVHDGLIDSEFSGNDFKPFQYRPDDRPKKFKEWKLNDYYLQIEKWNAKYPQFAIESMGSYIQYRTVAELPNRHQFDRACDNERINVDEFFVAEKMFRLQTRYLQAMFKSESVSFEQTLEWVREEFYRLASFDEAKPLLKGIETKYEWIRRACVYEILHDKSMPLSLDLAKYVQTRVIADAVRPVDSGVLDNLANKMEMEVIQKPYPQTEISKFLHELKTKTNIDHSGDWNSVNEMILQYDVRSKFDVRYNLLIQLALHARKQAQTGNSRIEAALLHWITREYPHLRNNAEFRKLFIEALDPTMVAVKSQRATLADEALVQYKDLLKGKPTTPVILEHIKDRADLIRFIVAYNRMNPNRPIYTGNAWLQLVINRNFPNSILLSQKLGVMIWADIFKQVRHIEAADIAAKANRGNTPVVKNGFDLGLSDPNSTVRKAVRKGWNRAKGAFASWMDSGKSPELVPIRVSAGSSGSVNTVALNIVDGSSQAASGNETEVPKIEVVSAPAPANGSPQKPNLTTPESIYHYKFVQQQGWDFPTNRVVDAPEMAAYLDIAIQEKHPEFYSKWLAKLATISSKYEQVRVISQFMDLRPKTGFSYEHWFVLHLIQKQVQVEKLPITPQMVQNLMILAAKDQRWNEVAKWKVIAKELDIALNDLTEIQLKTIHSQQLAKKLVASTYEESIKVSKILAIDLFKNQIEEAVKQDPYTLDQLNEYLKEIYADDNKKNAWKELLKTMGLEASSEIRSMDSPLVDLLQRGLYVHLRSKLLQGLDLNHFLYAMRESVAEKYNELIKVRKDYDKKIAVTFKKGVFGSENKFNLSDRAIVRTVVKAYAAVERKVKQKLGLHETHFLRNISRQVEEEERVEKILKVLPWHWRLTAPKPFVEPTKLEVEALKKPAGPYEVHQLGLIMSIGKSEDNLKRLNDLLNDYTFDEKALRLVFDKSLSPIHDWSPMRPKIIETFFDGMNLEKGALDGVALSHLESEILEIGISEKTFIAAKPYLSEAEIKGIQLFFDAQKGNVDEVRASVSDKEINQGYKEFALRKAVMNNQGEVIEILAAQEELKSVVLDEFNRATDRYWLREKKVKAETVSALSKHAGRSTIQSHLDGDRLHDDLRPLLENALRIDIAKLLLKMQKWNSDKYEQAQAIIAEHGEVSMRLTPRILNDLFVELSPEQRSILLQKYVVDNFFVLKNFDLRQSISKLNLDINGPPKEGSIDSMVVNRRLEVVATHINRLYDKFKFIMNRDGTRGYNGGGGTLNVVIFPFPSIKTIKKAYKVIITFVELHLGINVGMLGSAIDILPVAGSEAKNALIAEISAKMDGKETVTRKLLKELIEVKGFRASDMTGLAFEALEHDKSDVFKFIAGLEESKFNPNQTRIYDGEAITLVERAIQLELHDQFRILMGLNHLDPKIKTKFAPLVKEKSFNKYVSNPTESTLSEITLTYNEALKAKETVVVEKPAPAPVEIKEPVSEVKVVVAKDPNEPSEVFKRAIVEQVMSGTINGDEGVRKLLQDKRAAPALINETLIEVASKIESKRTRVNRPFFSIESLATLVQHPNADVELGLKAIAIAFERSNKDYHGPLDQAEDVLEIRLKQEQVAKTIATPASNESKGRIAKWWSQTKNYFARKNIQPSESVSKVIAENVSVPAEIAPAEIAILNEYELVPESIAPEKLVVELVQEAEVKKVVETSVELPAAEEVKTETVAKTPKLKVQAKPAVVQNDSNLQAEIERKNLLHTIATKIRGEKKPVISKLLKSNLIRAQDIESLTELALENNKPHYFNELFQHSLFEPTDKILFLTIQLGQYKPFKAVMKHKRVNQKRYARFKCLLDEERNFDRYSKNLKQETLVAIQKEYQENLSQQKIERGEIVLVEPIIKVEAPVRGEAELESTDKSGGGYLYTFIIPPPRELAKIWRAFIGLFRSTQSAPENVVVAAPEVAPDTRVHIETLDLYERFIAWNKIILDRTKANYRDGEAYEKTLLALFPELSAEQKILLRNKYIQQNISFFRDESGWPTAEKFIHEFNVALPAVEDSEERSRVKEAIEHMNSVHERYVEYVVSGPKEFQVAARPIVVSKPEGVKAEVVSIEKPVGVGAQPVIEQVEAPATIPEVKPIERSVYKNHPDLIKKHRESLRGATMNKILHDELHVKSENLTAEEISFIRNYIDANIIFSASTGGNTFLHTACEKGYHPKIIQMLADHGFSMNVVNSKGYSPTALWVSNYIKTVEAHPERVDVIDQVIRNLNNKHKIRMDAQHIPGGRMLPDYITEKVPVRAHRKHILADLKIPDFKYTNDIIDMIHRNIVLGEFPNYEKVLEHVEKGIDIFDYYYDRHGYEQHLSQLFKLLVIFEKQEEFLGKEKAEKTKDLLGKIILTAFDKQAKPDAGLLRADELRLITRLGVGFHADAYVHKGPYVFKHDYALRSEIFYRYVIINPEILATNTWVLDQFVYIARELETAKFENCLDQIFKLSFEKQQTIYNYFSNAEESGKNTYNRTLVNQAVFAEVDISYLRKMRQNGADFTIQNDHYMGHDEEGKPRESVGVHHHLDVIIRYAFHFKNRENAKKVFKFLLDEVGLLPRHKLKNDFIEEFAVAMREYGFTAEETKEIATSIHQKQFKQEESSEKLLATMQRELDHSYKHGVFRDRVVKETEFAQLVKAAIAKSEAKNGGSLAKEHEQEKIREFLKENTTNESKKNVWSEIEKALNIKQLHAGNKGSKERANQFESRSAHAHFTGNPKPGVTYPHKITFEKIQELKKYKEWVLENFPKEITAYNEKMGNPNAFNELLSLSMSKEVMIFGGASDTQVAAKDPTVRNFTKYKGHLEGAATGQQILEDGTLISNPKPLRKAQVPFFQKILDHFIAGNRDGFIVSPKGTGKTVLFSKLIEAFKPTEARPVYILEESVGMVHQTYARLKQFTNISNDAVGRVGDYISEIGKPVTVMTYASFVKLTKEGVIKPNADALVIYDEAHRSLSELRGKIAKMWSVARRFGVTASDKFSELKQVANILHHEIWRLPVPDAIDAEMMAPQKVIGIRFDKVDVAGADRGKKGFDDKKLSKILQQNRVTAPIIEAYKEYLPLTNAPLAVVNCVDIQDAETTANDFRKAGIEAIAVHGGNAEFARTPEQQKVIRDFSENRSPYKVLMLVKLGEGLDFQDVGLVLNKAITYSDVNNVQRVPNTRISERYPNKLGIVLEFIYANSRRQQNGQPLQKLYSEVIQGDERFPQKTSPYSKFRSRFEAIAKRLSTYSGKDIVVVSKEELISVGAKKTNWQLEFDRSPAEAANLFKQRVSLINQSGVSASITSSMDYPKSPRLLDLPSNRMADKILIQGGRDWVWLTNPEIDYARINWLAELRKSPVKAAKLLQGAIAQFNEGKAESGKIKGYATYPKSVRLLVLPNEMMAARILKAANKTWSYACQSTETKGYWREQLERNPSKAYELLKKAWTTHVAENKDAKQTSKYYDKVKDDKLPATYVAREIMDAAGKNWDNLFDREVKFEKINWTELSEKTPQKAARLLRQKLLALNDGRENKITNTGNYPEVTKDLDIPSLKTAKKVLDAAGKDMAWAVKKPKLSPVMPMGPAMLLNPDGIEWLSYHAYEFGQRLQSKMDALTDHLQVFMERFPARLASIKEWILLAVDGRYVSSDKAALLKERQDAGLIDVPGIEPENDPSPEDKKKMEKLIKDAKAILRGNEYVVKHRGQEWTLNQIREAIHNHNKKESSKNRQITGPKSMDLWAAKANIPDRDKVAALLLLNKKNQDWFYKTEFNYDLDAEIAKYKKENPLRKLLVEKGRLWTANELLRIKDEYNNNPKTPESEKITNTKTWSQYYSKANLPEDSMIKTVTENDGYSKEWLFGEVEKDYHLETEINKFKKQYPGFKPIVARGRVWTAKLFVDKKSKYNETLPKGKKIVDKTTLDRNYSRAGLPDSKTTELIITQSLGIGVQPVGESVESIGPTLEEQITRYKTLNGGRLPVVFQDKVWTAFEILYLKDEYNKNVSEKLRITDWETWIRYFREAKLPDIAIAEKILITDLKTEFYLFGTISNFADLQAAVEKHNEIFKDEPEKQLRKFDKTWDQNRKFSKLNIPEIKIARGFIRGDGKTIAQLFKRGPSGISGAFFEEKPVDLATVQEIAKVQILTGPENVGEVKRNGTGPNVYSSIIPGLPQFINWVQKKVSGGSSLKPQPEPTNEDMNSAKDLDKYLTDLQIKMATMIEKDNGKLKLSSLKDTKAFETLVQYFQSQRWNMTEVDRDTLRKFVAKQQRQAARGNKLSQSLMSIKLVSELMEVLYKDTTGASFKAEFEEMKNREAATPRWFEEHIVDKLGKYQNEGRAVMRVSVTAGRESGKFMFALLMNTVIEEFTNPTVGLKEFIHLVNDTPHHLLGLATFSLGAGGGSTLSKLIADRVYGASIEGIQYQVQRSLIRGSQAKLTASMTVGLRTYVRGQIGFIVGSIVNGYLYDDHNDPMFWDRQVKSIGSFMIASAMVKGSIYSSVKIVEAFRLVRSGTAAASVNPAGLIWQGLILTAEIYVAPIVQAFYEKSEMQAKLEPMMAQPFHEYIAVLTGKTYGTGCNQAEKPQVLVCLQNKILLGVQQNWQMLTQYELNRKYQEHLAEFSEWEKDDVASKMVASTDNIYQAVKSSMDMVYSPSMTASKALYQTDQKIIALSPWRDISKLGERFRVVLPVANTQMMQEGTQEYFEELEELNTDYVNDMVSMFKEFNEDMTEDERVRKRYDELTKAKEQETKDINICNAGLEEEKQTCKQEAEKKYYENLVSIVNGGSSELTSTQERVWNSKRSSNPFAMMKFFGAKTYGLEKIPSITFGGRASASEMLDLIIQMSQKISALKPTEEAVIQAQKETVELLLMMYQELTVDVWQHIYFTDQTNPYVGQDKIKEVEMVSSYMPYGYDHASKTLNRKSFTPWMTSTQQKYVMVLPEKKPEKVDDYAFARVIVDQLLQKGIIQIPLARGDERMQKLYEAMQTYFLLALGYKPDDYSSLFYLAENINIADLKKMDRVVEAYKKMGTTSLLSNYECEAVRDQNALSVEERNKRCINSKSISIQIMQQPSVASDAQMASMDSKTKNAHYWRSKFRSPTKLSLTVPYGQMFIHDSTLNTLLSVH